MLEAFLLEDDEYRALNFARKSKRMEDYKTVPGDIRFRCFNPVAMPTEQEIKDRIKAIKEEKKAAYEAWKQKKAAEKKSRSQPVRQQRQIIMN